jgi:hypothetical protein
MERSAAGVFAQGGSLFVEQQAGRSGFAYFNNDVDAQATRDAQLLRREVARHSE